MWKQLLASVLCLAASTLQAASFSKTCEQGTVNVSCVQPGWGIGAEALFLQAGLPNLDYVGSTHKRKSYYGIKENYIRKGFEYGAGFKLQAFYHVQNGKDVNVNWYHYNHTTVQSLPSRINVYDVNFGGKVRLTLKPRWDAVNFELGQRFDFSTSGSLRLHGGIQYANIKMDNIVTGTRVALFNGKQRVNNSYYYGVGIRIGGDYSWHMTQGFAIYTNAAGAILKGRHEFKRSITLNTETPRGTYLDKNHGFSNASIAELEGKLGASYTRPLAHGVLDVVAGWMLVNYFDVLQIADSFHGGRTKESNFAVDGPFVGLSWRA